MIWVVDGESISLIDAFYCGYIFYLIVLSSNGLSFQTSVSWFCIIRTYSKVKDCLIISRYKAFDSKIIYKSNHSKSYYFAWVNRFNLFDTSFYILSVVETNKTDFVDIIVKKFVGNETYISSLYKVFPRFSWHLLDSL